MKIGALVILYNPTEENITNIVNCLEKQVVLNSEKEYLIFERVKLFKNSHKRLFEQKQI